MVIFFYDNYSNNYTDIQTLITNMLEDNGSIQNAIAFWIEPLSVCKITAGTVIRVPYHVLEEHDKLSVLTNI
ncbi:hypothetical protein M0Q97_07130 [Candidatus Dojkabacteria bacterium]|nr:hypothetical protein [Candidatus Dojkabacteria bacterium]